MCIIDANPNRKKSIFVIETAKLRAFRKDLLKFIDLVDDRLHTCIARSNNARIDGGAIVCKIVSQSWSAVEVVREIDSPIGSSRESAIKACKSSVPKRV